MKLDDYEGFYLSQEDIIKLHDDLIDESEFNDDKGFIDVTGALFDNAYHGIFAGFGGYEIYPTILEKTCRLCYNIISSHVFSNANKRTGLFVLLQMLEINGFDFVCTQDELFDLVVGIASHKKEYEDVVEFVKTKIVNKEKIDI